MSINYVFTFRLILTHPKCSAKINEQRCRFKRPYWSGLGDIGPWFWWWRRRPITFWAKFSPTRILFMFWWMDFHAPKIKNKFMFVFIWGIFLETIWKSSAMANISSWWKKNIIAFKLRKICTQTQSLGFDAAVHTSHPTVLLLLLLSPPPDSIS